MRMRKKKNARIKFNPMKLESYYKNFCELYK